MKLELYRVSPDGSGSFIVYLADGTTFHQQFYDAPVHDSTLLLARMTAVAAQAVARMQPEPRSPVPQDVEAMKGEQLDALVVADIGVASAPGDVAVKP